MAQQPRRTRKTQHERVEESAGRLLQAALDLISERGFAQITMSEIGARAGYSHTMVRTRYGSKEALLDALIEREFRQKLEAPLNTAASGLEQTCARIDRLEHLRQQDPRLLRALYVLQFEAVGAVPELNDYVRGWLNRVRADVITALDAGKGDGSVDPAVDVARVADRFVTTSIGIAYCWSLEGDAFDHARAIREWRAVIIEECRPKSAHRSSNRSRPRGKSAGESTAR